MKSMIFNLIVFILFTSSGFNQDTYNFENCETNKSENVPSFFQKIILLK